MIYLYHSVPKVLVGNTLYPLNQLKSIYPEVYQKEFSKYAGREQITEQKIPGLNCLWNDVLHFSAVHPSEVKSALLEAGDTSDFKRVYYQIDPELIDPAKTIVYLHLFKDLSSPDNWTAYDPKELAHLSTLPQRTKSYYADKLKNGERPLLYLGVPHILYKGTLDTTDLPIITPE